MIDKQELVIQIKDAMDVEYEIESDRLLSELDEWDSLAVLTILSYFHDNDIDIEVEDLEAATTIDKMYNIINR